MSMGRFKTIKFDVSEAEFPFHQLVQELFGTNRLELLHQRSVEKYTELFVVGHDSSTVFHQKFYDKYHAGWPEMQSMYDDFIELVIAPFYNEDFLYQKFPTFRVHLPDNIAVGRYHRDAEFGHPVGEENYVIPLTNSRGTSSIWMESEQGKADFVPMNLEIGRAVKFNGNQLTHGNKVNTTGETRVSMDFRVLPISCYHEDEQAESLTRKTKFKDGEYYKRYHVS
jgi:hypothetical protein